MERIKMYTADRPIAYVSFEEIFQQTNSFSGITFKFLKDNETGKLFPLFKWLESYDSEKYELVEYTLDFTLCEKLSRFKGKYTSWYVPAYQYDVELLDINLDSIAGRNAFLLNRLGNYITHEKYAELQNIICFYYNRYNPLDNYDRHEVFNETTTTTYNGTETDTTTYNGTETDTTTYNGVTEQSLLRIGDETTTTTENGTETDINIHDVIGMNTNDFDNGHAERDTNTTTYNNRVSENKTEYGDTREDKTTTSYNGRNDAVVKSFDQRNDAVVKSFDQRNDAVTHTSDNHLYGNIGVTTSVAMALEQMSFVGYFDLEKWVCDSFAKDCCIVL